MKFLAIALLGVAVCQAAILGGYRKVREDNEDVQKILSFVESSINMRSNDMFSSRVSDIFSVQRQTVEEFNAQRQTVSIKGFNYKIEFEFSRTGCSKMGMIALATCPLSGRVEKCKALVDRPIGGEPSLTNFDCQPAKAAEKRMAGGVSKPVDNPEKFRDEAIRALSSSNSLLDASKGFDMVEVRTQVVSGLMYYMTIRGQVDGVPSLCDFTIWSRPWIEEEEGYKVSPQKCSPVESEKRSLIGDEPCAGCIKDVPNSETIENLLGQAIRASNDKDLTDTIDPSTMEIVSVKSQVVAGIKYYIKLQTLSNGKVFNCDVELLNQPWMAPATRVLKHTCK